MQSPNLVRLAGLFAYPQGSTCYCVTDLADDFAAENGAAASALREFAQAWADLTPEQQQELFVRTFDLNPLCSLEVGWQLYGDHYDRGAFLVRMRQKLRELGLTESTELPDHLSLVLELLGQMPDQDAARLAAESVLPAVDKMLDSLRETDNPYRHLLRAARVVVGAMAAQAHQEVNP